MAKTYTVHQAKTNLSRLIEEASSGEEIVISRGKGKKPVAKIVAVGNFQKRRKAGTLAGLLSAEPAAFKALTAREARDWGIE